MISTAPMGVIKQQDILRKKIEKYIKKQERNLNKAIKESAKRKKIKLREEKKKELYKQKLLKEKERQRKKELREEKKKELHKQKLLKEKERQRQKHLREEKKRSIVHKRLLKEAKKLNQQQIKIDKKLKKQERINKLKFKKDIKEKVALLKKLKIDKKKHLQRQKGVMKELRKKMVPLKTSVLGPPPLKKLDISKKGATSATERKYKLENSDTNRQIAIMRKIVLLSEKDQGMPIIKAAKIIKGRFNVLRIFHKNKNPEFCKKLTRDMRYIDSKYLKNEKAKTNDIC